jgi:hypothetical protein
VSFLLESPLRRDRGQRDGGAKGQGDRGTDGGTEGRRDRGTDGGREGDGRTEVRGTERRGTECGWTYFFLANTIFGTKESV